MNDSEAVTIPVTHMASIALSQLFTPRCLHESARDAHLEACLLPLHLTIDQERRKRSVFYSVYFDVFDVLRCLI